MLNEILKNNNRVLVNSEKIEDTNYTKINLRK